MFRVTLHLRDGRAAAREFRHESDANMLVAMAMLPPGTGDPLVARIVLAKPDGTAERWTRDHASGLWRTDAEDLAETQRIVDEIFKLP